MLSGEFSYKRVAKLICNDIYIMRWTFILSWLVAIVWYWTLTIISWTNAKIGDPNYGFLYKGMFVIYGLFYTMHTWKDYSSLKNGVIHLSQPALASEKFIAKFIWTGPLYVAAFNFFWFISSIGINIISNIFMDSRLPIFPIVPIHIVHVISSYLLLHSVAMAGAMLFKKQSTLLTLACFGVSWLIIAVICSIINVGGFVVTFLSINFVQDVAYPGEIFRRVNFIDTFVIYALMMPLFWSGSYLLFKHRKL